MIKHPAFRVRSIEDVAIEDLENLEKDLLEWKALIPGSDLITDLEIVGSYARNAAELHSDLDINIATGDEAERFNLIQSLKDDKESFRASQFRMREIWKKYGLRIDVAMQHSTVKNLSAKSCYSLGEKIMYGTEKRRMDIDYVTGIAKERVIVRTRPPKLSLSVWDEELSEHVLFDPTKHDPWLSDLPKYRSLYGNKLLEYGYTEETLHMRTV